MIVLNHFTHDARVHREAKTLSNAGHSVEVVALHKPGLAKREQTDNYRVKRLVLKSRRWRGGRIAPILKFVEFTKELAENTRSEPPDVYHSHNANTLLATFPLVRRDAAAWVYDSHELETGRNFANSRLSRIYQWLWPLPERLFIRRADEVISASPSYADQLGQIYGIVRPTVVANMPEFFPPVESRELQDRFRIPPQNTVVLYQGGVMRNRGIEVAIRSLQHLDPTVHLAILGDGPAMDELTELSSQLNLLDRVHFAGHIPLAELPNYTASADLGLALIQNSCPSYYYTLPNKVFEYIMAGIPAIVSDFPAMARVIHDHQVGEVVQDPSCPKQLALAVKRAIEDKERYRRTCENARQAALILNWENEQEKLLSVYRRISEGRADA
jgi:glycosyltransferase involved in cell wall biosynthesis